MSSDWSGTLARELDGAEKTVIIGIGNLLNGDTPFSVDASVVSGRGTVTVNIERLTIAAQEFDSSATDFLLGWLLRPFFGNAKLGEPIPLEHNVESIQIRPNGVEIRIAE